MTDPNLKSIEGQIISISHEKSGLAIRDKNGDVHPFYWDKSIKMENWKGEPLKEGWFEKITGEFSAKTETWWVIAHEFFRKPADWPKFQRPGGSRTYGKSPEERKDIRLMACLKAATEIATSQIGIATLCDDEIHVIEKVDGKPIEPELYEQVCFRVARAAVEMEKVLSGEKQ